jgi:branched-chain amino acid transport system permease protein
VIGWMDTIIQGVLLGGVYALFAMGLSLAFGVMRLVNIAHGDFIVLAAFLALLVAEGLSLSPLTALIFSVPAMFALGYLLQRLLLNRTLGTGLLPPLLVTFGLSMIIQNGLLLLFSADPRALRLAGFETSSFGLGGGITIGYFPLLVLVVAVGLTGGLELLFRYTVLGRAFRAASDDLEAARLMGIDDRHVYSLAMGLALAIAGIAAVFYGIRTTFSPTDGPDRLLFAFEAVIIGGLGSFWGALAGGITLGVAQAAGFRFDPGWGVLAGHLAFLAVLLLKPEGFLPKTR